MDRNRGYTMRCEICGQPIMGKPNKVIVEGAKLVVCDECSKLGVEKWEEKKPATSHPKQFPKPAGYSKPSALDDELALIEDYGLKIKMEREKRSWSQEELASKINEKTSFISKIETGKVIPNIMVTKKLEHLLGITLRTTIPQVKVEPSKTTAGLTLGDLISSSSLSNRKGEKPESNSG